MKTSIELAVIGHAGANGLGVRTALRRRMAELALKYDVKVLVVIEDDDTGKAAAKIARSLGLRTSIATRSTSIGNFLPAELAVGMTMWMATHFLLTETRDRSAYSSIAREMCRRMPRKCATLNM